MKLTPEQALRDLVWAVQSPSFVDGPNTRGDAPDVVDAASLDADALVAFLAPLASHRVGRYFESLLLYWLERVRRVDMVGSAIQVRDGNRTVGEIDFLFRDEQGRLTHWEVAIKFYLHQPDRVGSHFPGPNATDDFERKADKLFGQQLQLVAPQYPAVAVRRGFVKGRGFYHPLVGEPAAFPARMAADHLRGSWVRANELDLLEAWGDVPCRVTEKPFWLARADDSPEMSVAAIIDTLRAHFAMSQRPLMIDIGGGDHELQVHRLCVVSEGWDMLQQKGRRKSRETF